MSSSRPDARRWARSAATRTALFVIAALAIEASHADVLVAGSLFFDAAAGRWLGAGAWWANEFLHTGGRWFVRACVAAALLVWWAGTRAKSCHALRRPAAYFAVAVVLSVALVGALKTLTNVDCPWDLQAFGGRFPYVPLFADRPDALRAAHCFPAAHASSGYALMALYFALRERTPALASAGLALGVTLGIVFGIAQQARGAHFISHDLWSVYLVWLVCSGVYTFGFGATLWPRGADSATLEQRDDFAPAAFAGDVER